MRLSYLGTLVRTVRPGLDGPQLRVQTGIADEAKTWRVRATLVLGFALVSWFWFDSWNGAWIDGYRSGRCESKCGFAADLITFVPERDQIICTCRDGSVWRMTQ
jgi:hypothetical protein